MTNAERRQHLHDILDIKRGHTHTHTHTHTRTHTHKEQSSSLWLFYIAHKFKILYILANGWLWDSVST